MPLFILPFLPIPSLPRTARLPASLSCVLSNIPYPFPALPCSAMPSYFRTSPRSLSPSCRAFPSWLKFRIILWCCSSPSLPSFLPFLLPGPPGAYEQLQPPTRIFWGFLRPLPSPRGSARSPRTHRGTGWQLHRSVRAAGLKFRSILRCRASSSLPSFMLSLPPSWTAPFLHSFIPSLPPPWTARRLRTAATPHSYFSGGSFVHCLPLAARHAHRERIAGQVGSFTVAFVPPD